MFRIWKEGSDGWMRRFRFSSPEARTEASENFCLLSRGRISFRVAFGGRYIP